MADNLAEIGFNTTTALPWVVAPEVADLNNKEISLEVLGAGIGWIKGDLNREWKGNLEKLEQVKPGSREKLDVCIKLANLQRDLACYLFLISQDQEAVRVLGSSIRSSIFGESQDSLVNCLGSNRRGFVEGTLVGAISNLTFYDFISKARPDLSKRLNFSTMVVGGKNDALFKIDAVLDFGTKKNNKRVLRVIQLKAGKEPQVIVEKIKQDNLRSWYSGGAVSKSDVKSMIEGSKKLYPDCEILSFVVTLPSFDSPSVYNIFGRINKNHQYLVMDFKEQAKKWNLLPKL